MVVVALCHLVGDRPLTAEEERLSFTLGWCLELVSTYATNELMNICDCLNENPPSFALASISRNTILKIQFKKNQPCLGIGLVQ